MGEDPPLFAFAMELYADESHRDGKRKDTLSNILEREEFVINMVDGPILDRAILCGSDFPSHISEPEAVGFPLAASSNVSVPRIAEAPIAWECKLFKQRELTVGRIIVFGEVIGTHFRDDLLDEEKLRGRVDRFEPYGRLRPQLSQNH